MHYEDHHMLDTSHFTLNSQNKTVKQKKYNNRNAKFDDKLN